MNPSTDCSKMNCTTWNEKFHSACQNTHLGSQNLQAIQSDRLIKYNLVNFELVSLLTQNNLAKVSESA